MDTRTRLGENNYSVADRHQWRVAIHRSGAVFGLRCRLMSHCICCWRWRIWLVPRVVGRKSGDVCRTSRPVLSRIHRQSARRHLRTADPSRLLLAWAKRRSSAFVQGRFSYSRTSRILKFLHRTLQIGHIALLKLRSSRYHLKRYGNSGCNSIIGTRCKRLGQYQLCHAGQQEKARRQLRCVLLSRHTHGVQRHNAKRRLMVRHRG